MNHNQRSNAASTYKITTTKNTKKIQNMSFNLLKKKIPV